MPERGTRIDAHVKVLDERTVERAKARGIDALVYAPHFRRLPEIEARAARFSDDDLLVVPAREVFTGDWRNRRHLLALGLSDPIPDFITFEAAMAELERQDAAILVPHPAFATVSLTQPEIDAHGARIDAVETYNTKLLAHQNQRARRIADELDLPAFGSSYAHLSRTTGEAWTVFDDDLSTEADVVDAFKTDTPRRVVHRSGAGHHLYAAIEFAHLGYENTWKRLDRELLSGEDPTNPYGVFYEGRFDDVAVY
ncbi:PHP-associated domain-containing protein [Halopenitus sp. H-Gu1]|uniref:PHP-associated domain-containing protein n=1 Tax=Halopenitus sp. H-Gu1 TaxID=3242697 RepID=UPI00359EA30B